MNIYQTHTIIIDDNDRADFIVESENGKEVTIRIPQINFNLVLEKGQFEKLKTKLNEITA